MPIYSYRCRPCMHDEDLVRTYEEREDPLNCILCEGPMDYVILSVPFVKRGGFKIAEDIGPSSKKTVAYEKKQDDANSEFFGPGDTGHMSSKKRMAFEKRVGDLNSGKTKFDD